MSPEIKEMNEMRDRLRGAETVDDLRTAWREVEPRVRQFCASPEHKALGVIVENLKEYLKDNHKEAVTNGH